MCSNFWIQQLCNSLTEKKKKKIQGISDHILMTSSIKFILSKVAIQRLGFFEPFFFRSHQLMKPILHCPPGKAVIFSLLVTSNQIRISLRKYSGDLANKRPLSSHSKFSTNTAFQELAPLLHAQRYIVQPRKVKRPKPPELLRIDR